MKSQIFIDVIFPMLSVGTSSLIALSSISAESFFEKLFETKNPDGTTVFDTVRLSNQCKKCDAIYARMNRINSNMKKPICKHTESSLPHWLDSQQIDIMKDVYKISGNEASFQVEMCGVLSSTFDAAYELSHIERFASAPHYDNITNPEIIIMAVDPNMGGTSETAIVSAYMNRGNMVICGLDSRATSDVEKNAFMLSHIQALRYVSRFSNSKIVFLPENNINGAMFTTLSAFAGSSLQNVVCVMGPDNKEGAHTGSWSKIKYTRVAQYMFKNKHVFFDRDLTCSALLTSNERSLYGLKLEFIHQLKQWKVDTRQKANGRNYVTCSGKMDYNGKLVSGKNDDLAMAFVLAAWGIEKYDQNSNTLLNSLVYQH